jgi:hypothetical protein
VTVAPQVATIMGATALAGSTAASVVRVRRRLAAHHAGAPATVSPRVPRPRAVAGALLAVGLGMATPAAAATPALAHNVSDPGVTLQA